TIEEIIEKIATQSWADKFARSIEPFVFTLSRSLEANAKQGDRHSPAATVKEKWLYIYRKIKDDAQEKDY
ncbi:hypothetical protein COT40_00875, partial [Candidatus Peregrinibacteria bacterium CG08_land_8_20_14_0_20_41_10]